MLVGFLGHLHGRAFHGLAVLLEWQRRTGRRLDLAIQVGDLGEPSPDASSPHAQLDRAEADFARLLAASGHLAHSLEKLPALLPAPIPFVRGNHDDHAWLATLPPDGAVRDAGGLRIAFLGGVEAENGPTELDYDALERLAALGPASVDLLVTHEGPYGSSVGYHGDVHGSRAVSGLLERLAPRWHVAGHAHVVHGPAAYGRTTYLGLDGITASPRWFPDQTGLQPGCLAILDSDVGTLAPVLDDWLTSFDRRFDFAASMDGL